MLIASGPRPTWLTFEAAKAVVRAAPAACRSDPASPTSPGPAVLNGLGEPKRAEVQKLYHSDTLTILNVVWGPKMTIMPHDHRMWPLSAADRGMECRFGTDR
jgi:hypothetical protein